MPTGCNCNCGRPNRDIVRRLGQKEADRKARGCYGAKRGNAGAKHCGRYQNSCWR